mgnify:CR=1 FL=1
MRPLNDEDMPVTRKIKTLAEIIKELSEKLLKEVVKDDDQSEN